MEIDYFTFYQIPVSYDIDKKDLRKKFIEKSKNTHPDFFTLLSSEEQKKALEDSIINNKAYLTLKEDTKRLQYILKLKNILNDDEKYNLPNNFLMEMMDMNEQIIEAKSENNEDLLQELKNDCDSIEKTIFEKILFGLQTIDNKEETINQEKIIKENYYKLKYLLRIKESLNTFAAS